MTRKGYLGPAANPVGLFLEHRMPIQLIAALLISVAGFGSGWKVQQWRMDAQEAERAKRELVAIQDAAASSIRRQENIIEAQGRAVLRERQLRDAAAVSRGALVSVSNAAGEALRAAQDSHASCTVSAAALADVFGQCGQRYEALGAKASRHASDVQTLVEAWPK